MKNKVVVIAGATATGKTEVSIKFAERMHGEVISCDSVQVYKGLDVGSAKIKEEEKRGIIHHMLDVVDPEKPYDIAQFQKEARRCIGELFERKKLPVLVGGTGFYIQSVIRDVYFTEMKKDETIRGELEKELKEKGAEAFHEKLREMDPKSYESIHYNNTKRVIRALEYYLLTGKRISEHNEIERKKQELYDTTFFVLYFKQRNLLYERTDLRLDQMVQNGLFAEVEALMKKGLTREHISMQAIGYKEVLEYFAGEVSREECIENIKKNTRHLVKRQYTWFAHQQKDAHFIAVDDAGFDSEKIAEEMMKRVKE